MDKFDLCILCSPDQTSLSAPVSGNFFLESQHSQIYVLEANCELCPVDWYSHDRSMREVLLFLCVRVDNVVRVWVEPW